MDNMGQGDSTGEVARNPPAPGGVPDCDGLPRTVQSPRHGRWGGCTMSEDTQPTGASGRPEGAGAAVVVGGGLAWINRRARTGRRRGACHPARRPAAARRACLLLPARRTHRGQRTACGSALLHRDPGSSTASRGPRSRPCRIVSTCPFSTPRRNPGRRLGQNRPQRAARTTASRAAWRPISICLSQSAPRSAAPHGRLKALDLDHPALDQNFGQWLAEHGQSAARSVEALWDLVGVATLNAVAGDSSLGLAAMVFKTGLLSDPGAAHIGWARVPLGELHDTLARKALDSAGVRTEVRTRVTSISLNENGRWSVQVPGETLDASTVVLAVPQREAHDLLPAERSTPPNGCWRSAPRRSSTSTSSTTGRCSRDRSSPPSAPRQLVRPYRRVRTAAGAVPRPVAVGRPGRDRLNRCRAARALSAGAGVAAAPRARRGGDGLLRDQGAHRDVRPHPGVGRRRPALALRAPCLDLAGAWTATGWPATMESAVRSGAGAARAALGALGRPRDHLLAFEEAA